MIQVAVLLSTFNGEKYIQDQLKSIKNQKKVKIKIFIIDDGSTDNTLEIIKNFNIPKKIFKTKNFRDPVKNFLYLTLFCHIFLPICFLLSGSMVCFSILFHWPLLKQEVHNLLHQFL